MRASTGLTGVCAAGFVITAGEVLANGPLKRLDDRIALHYWRYLVEHGFRIEGTSVRIAHWLQLVGKPWIACLVVGSLGLIATLRSRRLGPALAAAVGLGIAGACTWIFKTFFPQPSIDQHLGGSFPSGHTCVAVVSAGLVVAYLAGRTRHRDLIALLAGGAWGALMAWGRLVMLAHWLSDVIAGWCLGMVALVVALRILDAQTTWSEVSPGWRALRRSRS